MIDGQVLGEGHVAALVHPQQGRDSADHNRPLTTTNSNNMISALPPRNQSHAGQQQDRPEGQGHHEAPRRQKGP